jgi:hypothetical protein
MLHGDVCNPADCIPVQQPVGLPGEFSISSFVLPINMIQIFMVTFMYTLINTSKTPCQVIKSGDGIDLKTQVASKYEFSIQTEFFHTI